MNLHENAAALLQAENDRRIAALDAYNEAQRVRQEREQLFAQAAADEATAWREVQQLWATKQLTQLGITGPTHNGASKPRRSAVARRKKGATEPSTATSNSGDDTRSSGDNGLTAMTSTQRGDLPSRHPLPNRA